MEYRPCKVYGKRALFHCWEEVAEIQGAYLAGQVGGQLKQTFGIVETEDGKIKSVMPEVIKFCGDKVKRVFEELNDWD